jgi:hypothetical protein
MKHKYLKLKSTQIHEKFKSDDMGNKIKDSFYSALVKNNK